jgi:hypothetical protein
MTNESTFLQELLYNHLTEPCFYNCLSCGLFVDWEKVPFGTPPEGCCYVCGAVKVVAEPAAVATDVIVTTEVTRGPRRRQKKSSTVSCKNVVHRLQ